MTPPEAKQMTRYFSVGWREGRAEYLLLKYLHFDPNVSFHFSGIVHDDPWWPAIDGIPCVSTKEFLDSHNHGPVALVDMGPGAVALWEQLPEHRPPLLKAGVLVRHISNALEGMPSAAIGPLLMPDCFRDACLVTAEDRRWFSDALSVRVLDAYLDWLENPRHSCFDRVMSSPVVTVTSEQWFIVSGFTDRTRPRHVLELCDRSTSLPEQFLQVMAPSGSYHLVTSDEDDARRHVDIVDAVRPTFLRVDATPEAAGTPDMVIISGDSWSYATVNKWLPEPCRWVQRVGDMPKLLRQAIDNSLAVHPHGKRTLRICGRYPNNLFFFSEPRVWKADEADSPAECLSEGRALPG